MVCFHRDNFEPIRHVCTIQPDGNSSALIFRELKNNYKIVIDRETALLLSIILNQYYSKGNIIALTDLFEKDK